MRRVATASAVLAATLLLGACTGDDPAPNYSSVSPTPSAPTTSAKSTPTPMNTRPGDTSPTPLPEISEDSSDGALAFATFYVQTIDWVLATGDVDLLDSFYSPDCSTCQNRLRYFNDFYGSGQILDGGRAHITQQAIVDNDGRLGADYAVSTVLDIDAANVIAPDGTTASVQPPTTSYTLTTWITRSDNSWLVVEERRV